MGKRGPQKTPTAKLAHRGSWRAKERAGEPLIAPGTPECPDWLSGESKEIWGRLVPELVNLGVMSKMEGFPFSRYCIYSVLWLQELGKGNTRNVQDFERYANQCLKLEAAFGLTPASRAGLDVQKPDPKDTFIKLA